MHNLKETSCADELLTAFEECMCSIRYHLSHDHEFAKRLESDLQELPPLEMEALEKFRDILFTKRPHDLADAVLCPRLSFPDLAVNIGTSAQTPKLFAFKCMEGWCQECGIDIKFPGLRSNSMFLECDTDIKVYKWEKETIAGGYL